MGLDKDQDTIRERNEQNEDGALLNNKIKQVKDVQHLIQTMLSRPNYQHNKPSLSHTNWKRLKQPVGAKLLELGIRTFKLIEPNAFIELPDWSRQFGEVAIFRIVQCRPNEVTYLQEDGCNRPAKKRSEEGSKETLTRMGLSPTILVEKKDSDRQTSCHLTTTASNEGVVMLGSRKRCEEEMHRGYFRPHVAWRMPSPVRAERRRW